MGAGSVSYYEEPRYGGVLRVSTCWSDDDEEGEGYFDEQKEKEDDDDEETCFCSFSQVFPFPVVDFD